MLRKSGSQLSVGRENPQPQHIRTSWGPPAGVDFRNISKMEWACPPQFMVDPNWKTEAGSESREIQIQLQRESTTAEAIYLRYTDIPANPSVASNALDFNGDDSCVPIIPLDVINDETSLDDDGIPDITLNSVLNVGETTMRTLADHPQVNPRPEQPLADSSQVNPRPEQPLADHPQVNPIPEQPLLQRDEVLGAAVGLIAWIKSKEPGNEIDLELLIQLLRNPGMLEQLTKEHGQPQERLSLLLPVSKPINPVVTGTTPLSVPGTKVPVGVHSTWSPSVPFAPSLPQGVRNIIDHIHKSESPTNLSIAITPSAPCPSSSSSSSSKVDVGYIRELINQYGVPCVKPENSSAPRTGPVVTKDPNYYRKLISQHGMVQENPNPQGSVKTIGASPIEPRSQLCVYYNSPTGCRRGSGCRFQHVKVNLGKQHGAKRMKLSGKKFS